MQAQELNTALTIRQTEAASPLQTAACKSKQVPNKAPSLANIDHKTPSTTPKGKSGGFSFVGIAG